MKKILFFVGCVAMLAACTPKVPQAEYDALKAQKDSIEAANAQMNEVLGTIHSTMNEMAVDEGLIFVDDNGNDLKDKQAVLTRLQNFREHMARQRQELEETKKKLRNSYGANSNLKKLIEELNAQIEAKDAQIAELQEELSQKNASIEDLKNRVREITVAKQEVEADRDHFIEVAKNQDIALNTGYYRADTKKALKAAGLIEGVFKKKAKYQNLDASLFEKVDIREFTKVTIQSRSPKLITVKPQGSYTLQYNTDGTTTLIINDVAKFWDGSPYLIVQL
ncbi:MAG: hypothetical protein J6W69_04035 [Bacteroidales bacterium]|nr:hypothetical protein [Bacteroidales bacterium]